jgi:hypothetical protein
VRKTKISEATPFGCTKRVATAATSAQKIKKPIRAMLGWAKNAGKRRKIDG